ncbi:hypothetical protein L0152_31030 [bacterium]|nr:hypothetical protein [bacterium]
MILKNRIQLIALSILLFNIVIGQSEKNLTEDSYKRARSTLDSTIQAYGGIDLLRAIRTVTLKEIGTHRYIHQSPTVDPPFLVSQFTNVPDALARKPMRPVIEIIRNQKHVLSDPNHTIELYDVGPNPVANEIVVVYLPKEKILYQTDLINPGYAGTLIPAQIGTVHFATKDKRNGTANSNHTWRPWRRAYNGRSRSRTPKKTAIEIELIPAQTVFESRGLVLCQSFLSFFGDQTFSFLRKALNIRKILNSPRPHQT